MEDTYEWAAKDHEFATAFIGLMIHPESHQGKAGIELLARTLGEVREQGRREPCGCRPMNADHSQTTEWSPQKFRVSGPQRRRGEGYRHFRIDGPSSTPGLIAIVYIYDGDEKSAERRAVIMASALEDAA